MELDHLFFFVDHEDAAAAHIARLGLEVTYRRVHPGQGTANLCCAFDNAFLEFLWLTDATEAASPTIARMGLGPRAQWRHTGACPFGVAWRASGPVPAKTWAYQPPYLPPNLSITVLEASDEVAQPLAFTFPGTTAPSTWPPERAGNLQKRAGLTQIAHTVLAGPSAPDPDVLAIMEGCGLRFEPANTWSARVAVRRPTGALVHLTIG